MVNAGFNVRQQKMFCLVIVVNVGELINYDQNFYNDNLAFKKWLQPDSFGIVAPSVHRPTPLMNPT